MSGAVVFLLSLKPSSFPVQKCTFLSPILVLRSEQVSPYCHVVIDKIIDRRKKRVIKICENSAENFRSKSPRQKGSTCEIEEKRPDHFSPVRCPRCSCWYCWARDSTWRSVPPWPVLCDGPPPSTASSAAWYSAAQTYGKRSCGTAGSCCSREWNSPNCSPAPKYPSNRPMGRRRGWKIPAKSSWTAPLGRTGTRWWGKRWGWPGACVWCGRGRPAGVAAVAEDFAENCCCCWWWYRSALTWAVLEEPESGSFPWPWPWLMSRVARRRLMLMNMWRCSEIWMKN